METGNSRFRAIIQALNDAGATYVVVGGIATILHGYVRATLDVDLIVAFEPENLERLEAALTKANYMPRMPIDPKGLADPTLRESWQKRNMVVYSFVSINNPPVIVDVFISHPIPFDELLASSDWKDYYGTPTRTCSLEHLIQLKQLSNRPKDQDDIESLRIANERNRP